MGWDIKISKYCQNDASLGLKSLEIIFFTGGAS